MGPSRQSRAAQRPAWTRRSRPANGAASLAAALALAVAGLACRPVERPAPGASASTAAPLVTPAPSLGLPAGAYAVEWRPVHLPISLKPGERVGVPVTFRNIGRTTWPAGPRNGLYTVRLGRRWRRAGADVVADFGDWRVDLPGPVAPGRWVTVVASLVAPATPGDYVVQFDLVHEGVTWFADRDAAKKLVLVKVREAGAVSR